MNDLHNENQLLHLRTVSMDAQEKDAVYARVRGFVAANPARPARRWYGWFVRHAAASVGIAAAVLATGTGVFAHYSAPDDLLYPVKLTVNDRIEVALAGDEDARIDKELEQMDRMFREEESLFTRESDGAEAEQDVQPASDEDENEDEDEDRPSRELNGTQDADDLRDELNGLEHEFRDMEKEAAEELAE